MASGTSLSVHGYIIPVEFKAASTTIGLSIQGIHDAIRCKIEDFLVPLNDCPVQHDNAPFEKPSSSCWLRANILISSNRQVDTGAKLRRYRTTGMLIFNIFTPINGGDLEANLIADNIVSIFRSTNVSGIIFKVPSSGVRRREGKEWTVKVECPFFADQLG